MDLAFDYAALALPIAGFLLAVAAASWLEAYSRPLAVLLLMAAGTLSALGRQALGAAPASGDACAPALEAAAALALFAAGVSAGRGAASRDVHLRKPSARRLAELLLPPALASAVVLGFALFGRAGVPGGAAAGPTDPLPLARTAAALACAFWLSSAGRDTAAVVLGGLGLVLLGSPRPDSPYFLAMAATLAAMIALSPMRGGRKARDPMLALASALAVACSWALAEAGVPWPAAGFAGGSLLGLRSGVRGGPALDSGRLSSWASYALAFAAGLALSPGRVAASPGSIALVAAAALATALARGLASPGRGSLAVRAAAFAPAEALGLAAMAVALRSGLIGDSAMAGLALAMLLAAPLSRRAADGASGADGAVSAIVGVSKRENQQGLVSFAAALGRPGEPVRAVCVAVPRGAGGVSVAEAEETLVRCMAASEARVMPSVIVSASATDGLARAALERRADAIIIGFRERGSQKDDDEASIEGILGAFAGAVIEARRPEALPKADRLVVVALAGPDALDGFDGAVATMGRAAVGSAVELCSVGGDETAGSAGPGGASYSAPAWRDVPKAVSARGRGSPAFAILAPRPASPLWNPGYARLPVILADAYPNAAVIVFHLPSPGEGGGPSGDEPSAEGREADTVAMEASGGEVARRTEPGGTASGSEGVDLVGEAMASGRVLRAMDEGALVDAIRRLTDMVFAADKGASGRLAAEFSALARKEPIELDPGVLLLHAHHEGVRKPTLALGSRPSGWSLVALPEPVRVVVILVSPADAPPAVHLAALTSVAKAFREGGLLASLL